MGEPSQTALPPPVQQVKAVLDNLSPDFFRGAENFLAVFGQTLPVIKSQLAGMAYIQGEDGTRMKLGQSAWGDPGGLGNGLYQTLDNQFRSQVSGDMADYYRKMQDQMLYQYFLKRFPDNPEKAKHAAQTSWLEKGLLRLALWYNGQDSALAQLYGNLKRWGVTSEPRNMKEYRRQQMIADISVELYKEAADLGLESGWQGHKASDSMTAMTALMEKGGLNSILNSRKSFDAYGNLTPEARDTVRAYAANAGRAVNTLQDMTGAKTATDALSVAQKIFGDSFLTQLTSPGFSQSLGKLKETVGMSGLSQVQGLQLLSVYAKKYDPATAVSMASQKALMDRQARELGIADSEDLQLLTTGSVAGAARSNWLKAAAAGKAALLDATGDPDKADYLMDRILSSGPARASQILRRVSAVTGRRMTSQDIQSYLSSDVARAYLADNASLGKAVTHNGMAVYRAMAKESPWFRRHAAGIIQKYGSLDDSAITNYVAESGGNQRDLGLIRNELAEVSRRVAARTRLPLSDPKSLLSFVSIAAGHRERAKALQEAENRSDTAARLADKRGSAGLEAGLRTIASDPAAGMLDIGANMLFGTDSTVTPKDLQDRGAPVPEIVGKTPKKPAVDPLPGFGA